jgi:hypothetical protein
VCDLWIYLGCCAALDISSNSPSRSYIFLTKPLHNGAGLRAFERRGPAIFQRLGGSWPVVLASSAIKEQTWEQLWVHGRRDVESKVLRR